MNVHIYRREHLEPEIVVITVEATPCKRALTVVNVDTPHGASVSNLRRVRAGTPFPNLAGGEMQASS